MTINLRPGKHENRGGGKDGRRRPIFILRLVNDPIFTIIMAFSYLLFYEFMNLFFICRLKLINFFLN